MKKYSILLLVTIATISFAQIEQISQKKVKIDNYSNDTLCIEWWVDDSIYLGQECIDVSQIPWSSIRCIDDYVITGIKRKVYKEYEILPNTWLDDIRFYNKETIVFRVYVKIDKFRIKYQSIDKIKIENNNNCSIPMEIYIDGIYEKTIEIPPNKIKTIHSKEFSEAKSLIIRDIQDPFETKGKWRVNIMTFNF